MDGLPAEALATKLNRGVKITGFTGWDRLLQLLPYKLQERLVSKRVLRFYGLKVGSEAEAVSVTLPSGWTFDIIDSAGRTRSHQ